MAKMHSGARGKSGSKRPANNSPKPWIKYSSDEVEQLVLKLAKSGKAASDIGIELRDSYGIPNVSLVAKKRIKDILAANKLSPKIPDDLMALIRREKSLSKHIEKNKQDKASARGLLLTQSKIRRLSKYYKREGLLPGDWFYSQKDVSLISS